MRLAKRRRSPVQVRVPVLTPDARSGGKATPARLASSGVKPLPLSVTLMATRFVLATRDAHAAAFLRVEQRIRQKIGDDASDRQRIGLHFGGRAGTMSSAMRREKHGRRFVDAGADQLRHVETSRLQGKAPGFKIRKLKDIADLRMQAASRHADVAGIFDVFGMPDTRRRIRARSTSRSR